MDKRTFKATFERTDDTYNRVHVYRVFVDGVDIGELYRERVHVGRKR